MSRVERQSSSENLGERSHIDIIREEGIEIYQSDPELLDRVGNPGHHEGLFLAESRSKSRITTIDGIEYYDATGYWMTESFDVDTFLGEDHKLLEEVGRMMFHGLTPSEFGTPEQYALDKKMLQLWPEAKHVHYYRSGTLATDNMAKAMKAQRALEYNIHPKDVILVCFSSAFHGRSGNGLELTDATDKTKDFQQGNVIRIPSPAFVFHDDGVVDGYATEQRVAASLEALEQAFQKSSKVAGVILEYPFQAEGGAQLIPIAFLKGASERCSIYRRFFGIDEVQMGGKGYPFPPEVLEVNPDYIAFGKFFGINGVMAKDPRDRGYKVDHMGIPGKYGATYPGSLAEMVVAIAKLDIVERYNLWENGRNQANRMYLRLRELAIAKKGILRPRISGAYLGFDLATKEARDAFVAKARDEYHVLFLPAGETAIRWSPRLDMTSDEVDRLYDVIESVL